MISNTYDDIIRKWASDKLPPIGMPLEDFIRLIKAVITHETGGTWNPNLVGVTHDLGLMQINPSNLPHYGMIPNDMFDPDKNIMVGVDIHRWSLNAEGNVHDGLEAYNGGPKNINLPVTEKYADRVLSIYNQIA